MVRIARTIYQHKREGYFHLKNIVTNMVTPVKNKIKRIRLAKIKKDMALIKLDFLLFSKNYTNNT